MGASNSRGSRKGAGDGRPSAAKSPPAFYGGDDWKRATADSSIREKEETATVDLMEEHYRLLNLRADGAARHPPLDLSGAAPYVHTPMPMPTDAEGYVQSFAPHETEAIRAFYRKYGVVVVRQVIDADEAKASEDEVWDFMERHNGKLKRDDARTWGAHWPSLASLGILGNTLVLSPQMCRNRQDPRVHQAFEAVLGTRRLWVNVGRASCMRPTRGVRVRKAAETASTSASAGAGAGAADAAEATAAAGSAGGGAGGDGDGDDEWETVDKPQWKTRSGWLHWDFSPWTGEVTTYATKTHDPRANEGYDDMTAVQGILALVDCGPEDGGFHCVPGLHSDRLQSWAHANRDKFNAGATDETTQVPEDDPIRGDIQRVPLRAGSLCIWSSHIAHGTFPNDSNHGRMVQYIKMWPVDNSEHARMRPLFTDAALLPTREQGFEMTPLGAKLLGLEAWSDEEGEEEEEEEEDAPASGS